VLITQRFERDRWKAIDRLLTTGDRDLLDSTTSRLVETERPWRLYYDRESRKSKPRRGPTLEASRAALVDVLTDAQAFCRRHRMGFVGEFGESLALLRKRNAAPPPHSDLLPKQGYSDDARRLLAAARKGWVFGPWGWSDSLTAADSVMHEFWLLDARLRASVIDALIAATNAFDGSQKERRTV
jgi:hypothetical protein